MDFELRRARERLEKEQKERKETARRKLEKERKAKDEAKKQREAIEVAQRSRRIHAEEAQLKADQEMEENLLAGRGVLFYRLLEAIPFDGNGDKVKLPSSCFSELSGQGVFDKGPIYLQLSVGHQEGSSDPNLAHKTNRRATHSGVLEFTADEGFIALPPHLWQNLFPIDAQTTTPLVEVRYVYLPKGTYAKLQPDNIGFSDLPNHKAILETVLRQYATLSLGDILTVTYGHLTYKLNVLELQPNESVSVLETDIEVDIEGADSASDRTDQPLLKPLTFSKPEPGMVEEGHYTYYKFSIDNDTWDKVASGETRVEVKIELESDNGGDTDIYISKHPLIFPTQHQHEWSSHDIGSKFLILSSKDKNFGAGTFSIGVYGFKGKTNYQISVSVQNDADRKVGQQAGSASSSLTMEVDTVECQNCKHYIPSRTIRLHEAYCSRHNVICKHEGCGVVLRVEEAKNHAHCEKCGQAVRWSEMEKHVKVFHEPHQCRCGVVLEKEQMVQHQGSDCSLRLIMCRFCGDMVQAGSSAVDMRDRLRGLSEHESHCGSRTAPCDSCGRSIMLKEMDVHQVAVHQKS